MARSGARPDPRWPRLSPGVGAAPGGWGAFVGGGTGCDRPTSGPRRSRGLGRAPCDWIVGWVGETHDSASVGTHPPGALPAGAAPPPSGHSCRAQGLAVTSTIGRTTSPSGNMAGSPASRPQTTSSGRRMPPVAASPRLHACLATPRPTFRCPQNEGGKRRPSRVRGHADTIPNRGEIVLCSPSVRPGGPGMQGGAVGATLRGGASRLRPIALGAACPHAAEETAAHGQVGVLDVGHRRQSAKASDRG